MTCFSEIKKLTKATKELYKAMQKLLYNTLDHIHMKRMYILSEKPPDKDLISSHADWYQLINGSSVVARTVVARTVVVKTVVAKTVVAKTVVAKTVVAKTVVAKTAVAKTVVVMTVVAKTVVAIVRQ